ncbi:uncharacterized protein LOC119099445, partial [Pollicipes pollicipes]|uniref:uncharacterized protein LOC119099445 n=1 Tax=Pollicipes pollicipes TaxID=41117 RepID=UPI0018849A50
MLSWIHWQCDLKAFVGEFLHSNRAEKKNTLEILRKRSSLKPCHMILSFPNNHEGQTSPYSDVLRKLCEVLPKVSRDWRYQIACAELDRSRILMTLAKPAVVIGAIQTIMNMKKEIGTRSSIALFLDTGPGHRDTTLTDERQLLVHDVICRLMTFMGHHVTEVAHSHDLVSPAAAPGAAQTLVCVTGNSRLDLRCVWAPGSESQATDPETEPRQTDLAPERQAAAVGTAVNVVVEPVVNLKTGKKELEVSPTEYRRRRQAALLSAGQSRHRDAQELQGAPLAQASVAHEL